MPNDFHIQSADFEFFSLRIITGGWSSKAAKEATKYGKVNLVLPKVSNHTTVPDQSTWNLNPNASYVYYCDNETADGEFLDTIRFGNFVIRISFGAFVFG